MPRSCLFATLLFASFLFNVSCENLRPGDTALFIPESAHGVVIDGRGNMYFAGDGKTVYAVDPDGAYRPFAKVEAKDEAAHIWSMKTGPDGNIYCAAKDRVFKLTPDGRLATVVANADCRDVGFGDLAFDRTGRLCVTDTDNNRVIRYARDYRTSSVIVDGSDGSLSFLVGIAFSTGGDVMYLVSCRDSRIVKYPYADGRVGKPESVPTPWACQYAAATPEGVLYVTLAESASVFRMAADGTTAIPLRPVADRGRLDFGYFNAIAPGAGKFDARFLYLTSPKGVYRVFLGDKR